MSGREYFVEECDGASDCEPPEPGKLWLSVCDPDGEEVCIVVHRGDSIPPEKYERAQRIARALQAAEVQS